MPTERFATLRVPQIHPIADHGRRSESARPCASPVSSVSSRRRANAAWFDEPATVPGFGVSLIPPANATRPDRAVLTVLLGINAGEAFALERRETVIGRSREANILVEDAGISRRHVCIRRKGGSYVLEDLGSTNGVFVNGQRVERTELEDGDRIQIGPSVVVRFGVTSAEEEALARRLYEGSTRDPLTGLFNRKYAGERLSAEVAYAQRHGTRLSLILGDIDLFKRINDGFGHAAGDVVLRIVAAQLQRTSRSEDVVARYGGEEFVVIVRGVEPPSVAILAERVRRAIERLTVPWESGTLKVTMSLGVASLVECGATGSPGALVALADERLYRAKAAGRNRVV